MLKFCIKFLHLYNFLCILIQTWPLTVIHKKRSKNQFALKLEEQMADVSDHLFQISYILRKSHFIRPKCHLWTWSIPFSSIISRQVVETDLLCLWISANLKVVWSGFFYFSQQCHKRWNKWFFEYLWSVWKNTMQVLHKNVLFRLYLWSSSQVNLNEIYKYLRILTTCPLLIRTIVT